MGITSAIVYIVSFIGIPFILLRKWIVGGRCRSTAGLDGKTVVITGGNTGIGKETALNLASRGATIVIACRDVSKSEAAANEIREKVPGANIEVFRLDLASLKSVRQFSKEIAAAKPFIHILINNAGIFACPELKTEDGFEMQFGVNHLGHFLLTNLLLDNIKASAPSRIINVSSLVHKYGAIHFDDINLKNKYSPIKAYEQSKLANVLFSRELARRLRGTGVSVYTLHPGVILATELGRHIEARLRIPSFLSGILKYLGSWITKTPEQGAQTTIYCAVDEDIQEHSGFYYSDCKQKDLAPQALDEKAAHKLWSLSEELVGLQMPKKEN